MVATSVLFDGSAALGALLRVGRDPVGRLGVVIALLDPLLDQVASEKKKSTDFRRLSTHLHIFFLLPYLCVKTAQGKKTGLYLFSLSHLVSNKHKYRSVAKHSSGEKKSTSMNQNL